MLLALSFAPLPSLASDTASATDATKTESRPFVNKELENIHQLPPGEKNKKMVDLWVKLSALYEMKGDYNRSVAAYEQALQIEPNDPSLLDRYGTTLLKVHRYDDATKAYEDALGKDPNYEPARKHLDELKHRPPEREPNVKE
jgi:tetratricopeptide (TPR) repeat protein